VVDTLDYSPIELAEEDVRFWKNWRATLKDRFERLQKPQDRDRLAPRISEATRALRAAIQDLDLLRSAGGSSRGEPKTKRQLLAMLPDSLLDVLLRRLEIADDNNLEARPFTQAEILAALGIKEPDALRIELTHHRGAPTTDDELRGLSDEELEAQLLTAEQRELDAPAGVRFGGRLKAVSMEPLEDTERRVGELMAAQRETVGLASGGQPYQSTGSASDPVERPTLADAGIDKHLADSSTPPVRQAPPAAPLDEPVPYQVINGVKVPLEPFKRPAYAFAAVHGYRGQREFADAARYVSDVMNGRERARESLF
jgi:hypothetical protein